MCLLFFHEEAIHEVSRRYIDAPHTHTQSHTHTDKPKPICPPLFQSWGHNNSNKRNNKKGNNENNGRLNEQSNQPSGTCISPGSDQVSKKRFHQAQPDHFDFRPFIMPDSYTPTISMSFQQMPQMSFGSQYMTSPPFNAQFPATGAGPSSTPPQWASQIMEDIKSIKISVFKIDGIKKKCA